MIESNKQGEGPAEKVNEKERDARVISLRDRSKNGSRTWPGFVKPIPNDLRKKQNLNDGRLSRAESSLVGRENGDRLRKNKRDKTMRSKSFEIQEAREIDRKEAGESRVFPNL